MKREDLVKLLESMTLEEKAGQLLQINVSSYSEEGSETGPKAEDEFSVEEIANAGTILGAVGAERIRNIQNAAMANQPHHIPLIFMADIINGYRTVFPIPLAQGCTFDPELARLGAEIAAAESAAGGLHLTFSPMVDLVRDSRWGRVMESTGEDVFLNCSFAKAIVQGYQGDRKPNDASPFESGKIAACVKHFAGYGAPMAGRDYAEVELSERTLREEYLSSYRAAIDAGAEMVMTSFNTLDRIPSSGNEWLMRDVLRKEMGFGGVVISDWAAIFEMISHGIAEDEREAAMLAIRAGVDIDMVTHCYSRNLAGLVRDGIIQEKLLDEAVMRVLELKNKLGLFENPYKDGSRELEEELILCDKHRETARKITAESFVLLKNDGILPLEKNKNNIALIGPHGKNHAINGAWSIFGKEEDTVSVWDALSREEDSLIYAKGCALLDNNRGLLMYGDAIDYENDKAVAERQLAEAAEAAEKAEYVLLAIGEPAVYSGEAASRSDIVLPACQQRLFDEIYKVNRNIIVILFSGRPLDIRCISERARAVLVVWQPGTEGGNAIADVLYGKVNPSGKLSMSFPYCTGQLPIRYSTMISGRPFTDERNKFCSRYLDIPNEPLYPFGYGLSYTDFEISDISLDKGTLTGEEGDCITASVTVKNKGSMAGKEVVQMYIRDMKASVARPCRELKGFKKILLAPGEEQRVEFRITEDMLRFYDIRMNYVSEPGEFRVYIGNCSNTGNEAVFTLA